MAKFLDKKEQVIDFQLTPYGKHRLSVGKLKPAYYAFFDTGITYDSNYAGFEEVQTKIHERIKDETHFLEGILSFEELENSIPQGNYQGIETDNIAGISFPKMSEIQATASGQSAYQIDGQVVVEAGTLAFEKLMDLRTELKKVTGKTAGARRKARTAAIEEFLKVNKKSRILSDELVSILRATSGDLSVDQSTFIYKTTSLFDLDIVPQQHIPQPDVLSFESSIGDAKFEGENTQAAPAFKLLTCQGEISSIKEKDTAKYDFSIAESDNEVKEFNIPQINISANYTLEISSPSGFLTEETPSDFFLETSQFADGNTIKLKRNDVVIYAEEVNTELLTENFEVEVYEMIEDAGVTVNATGTLTLGTSGGIQVGDTITINDGNTSVVFEFVDNTSADIKRAQGFLAGRVGVIVSNEYKIGGSSTSAIQQKGTIYNLISAIKQDNGAPSLGYPTESLAGTTSGGNLDYTAGRCRRGRGAPVGCYVGRHNLKVSVPQVAINNVLSHVFADGGYSFPLINENTTVGNINTSIEATSGGTPLRIITQGFAGGQVTKGTQLKRKYFADRVEQIVDGYMISANENEIENAVVTPNSVEYYFNLLTDEQVNAKIACSCASTFNRDSYYIDIDFNCIDELAENADDGAIDDGKKVYYDIYGSATAPEICNLPPVAQQDRFGAMVPKTDEECEDN